MGQFSSSRRLSVLLCLFFFIIPISGCGAVSSPGPSASPMASPSSAAQGSASPAQEQPPLSARETDLLQGISALPSDQIQSIPAAIALLNGLETIPDALISGLIDLAVSITHQMDELPGNSDAEIYRQNHLQLVEMEMGHAAVQPDYTSIREALAGQISPAFEAFFSLRKGPQERDIEYLYSGSGLRVSQDAFFDNLSQRYAFVQQYRHSPAARYGLPGLELDIEIFLGISALGNHGIYNASTGQLHEDVKAGYEYALEHPQGALTDLVARFYSIWGDGAWIYSEQVSSALETVDTGTLKLGDVPGI